jgi:hypothetical protein
VPANLLTCSCLAIYPHMHPRHVGVLNPDIRRDTAPDHHTVTAQGVLASCVGPTDNPQARVVVQAFLGRGGRGPVWSARSRAASRGQRDDRGG